jgi:hypothetical protein
MRREFHFKSSYLDESQFDVSGDSAVKCISTHTANAHVIDYYRSVYNHLGDPTSFDRNVVARQGGATVNNGQTRWTVEFFAFVEYAAKALARYNEVVDPWEPLPELRPMYYDREAHTYKVEGFYGIQVLAADGQMPAWNVSAESVAASEYVN